MAITDPKFDRLEDECLQNCVRMCYRNEAVGLADRCQYCERIIAHLMTIKDACKVVGIHDGK